MSEIHALITQTADAYQEASSSSHSPVSISAAYHSRFLRHLVHKDIFKARKSERERHVGVQIDPRLQGQHTVIYLLMQFTAYLTNLLASTTQNIVQNSPSQVYPHQAQRSREPQPGFHFPASPHLPAHPHHANSSDQVYQLDSQTRNSIDHGVPTGAVHYSSSYFPSGPHHATELDAHYWKNMFLELGFGENVDPHALPTPVPANISAPMPHFMENSHRQHVTHQQHTHHVLQPQGQVHYHPMHLASYGH